MGGDPMQEEHCDCGSAHMAASPVLSAHDASVFTHVPSSKHVNQMSGGSEVNPQTEVPGHEHRSPPSGVARQPEGNSRIVLLQAASAMSNGSAKRVAITTAYYRRAASSPFAAALVFASGASAIASARFTEPHGRAIGFGMSAIRSANSHTWSVRPAAIAGVTRSVW